METLVAHHRNHHQCYVRNHGGHSSTKFESFGSPDSGNFRGINCRAFQSGEGLLPTPSKCRPTKTSVIEKTFYDSYTPETPSPSLNGSQKPSRGIAKSRAIAIPINFKIESSEEHIDFSERWAGPTYSNSPPPSSVPIPKFSLRPKRSASPELPNAVSEINDHPIAKSTPDSPTREHSPSPCDIFDLSDFGTETSPSPCDPIDISVSATLTLRRILSLDDTVN